MRILRHIIAWRHNERGTTLLELLLAAVFSSVVAGAAFEFYATQHDSWVTQENITEAQQSLRACVEELSLRLRNAGAGLPSGMGAICGRDTNPDTLTVRSSSGNSALSVGDHTNRNQAVPIHVQRYSDLTPFAVGDRVYIFHPPSGPGEFFTITNLSDNHGSGWKEVSHQDQTLANDPMPGDIILKANEARFWIDRTTDLQHPRLMRDIDGHADVYAEEISDFQCSYTLRNGNVVSQPAVGDTVAAVDFILTAQTRDHSLSIAGAAGKLTRRIATRVVLRNQPPAA